MWKLSLLCCLCLGFGLSLQNSHASDSAQPVYWSDNGLVVMEIESSPLDKSWEMETDMEGYTGDGYYTWRRSGILHSPGSGLLTYRVMILQPGKWHLRIRNRHDYHDKTEQNDSWVRVNDGPWIKCFSYIRGKWNWISFLERSHSDKKAAAYELSAGLHTIYISGRSEGFSIDRIHLYLDGTKGHENASLPPSRTAPEMPPLDSLPGVAQAWEAGALGAALNMLERASTNKDPKIANQAQTAHKTLMDAAQTRIEQLNKMKSEQPAAALIALAALAKSYAKSDIGKELHKKGREWQKDPVVREAMAVEAIIKEMRSTSKRLSKGDRKDPKWLKSNQRRLKQLASAWKGLERKYPDNARLEEARKILIAAGITPPEKSES